MVITYPRDCALVHTKDSIALGNNEMCLHEICFRALLQVVVVDFGMDGVDVVVTHDQQRGYARVEFVKLNAQFVHE